MSVPKICVECEEEKEYDEFRKHRNRCIKCENKYNREYYQKNHLKSLEKGRKYYAENKDKMDKASR